MTETDSRATNAGGDGRFQLLHRRLDPLISNQIRSNSNHFHSNGAKTWRIDYPTGTSPDPAQVRRLCIKRHSTLPAWNYTIAPM
jgi:hypothetical protein